MRAPAFFLLTVLLAITAAARPFTVLVYNVENLFDVDGHSGFDDYAPPRYGPAQALTKLRNVTRVVASCDGGRGPDIIMFEEIEADQTPGAYPVDYDAILRRYAGERIEDMLGSRMTPAIADLPAEALLLKAMVEQGLTGYHVVAARNEELPESTHPLAQKCVIFTRFPVEEYRSFPTLDARAILEVRVSVAGAPLYLFDNHWKSGAGDPAMEKIRLVNARTLRRQIDRILRADPRADIIIGGDFNSQYNQKWRYPAMPETGINDVLGSQGNEEAVREGSRELYNLWFDLPRDRRGSDTYHGRWGTLMQIIVSRGLYDDRGVQYVDNSFQVVRLPGINANAAGVPLRWSFAGPAGHGFSDHFPVEARFVRMSDNRPDRWPVLAHPSVDDGKTDIGRRVDYAHLDLARVAVNPRRLPAGSRLRDGSYVGRIVRVTGRIGRGPRLTVTVGGARYDLWSYDRALLARLRANWHAGQKVRFYGELDLYKGRWQFIIRDPSWVQ